LSRLKFQEGEITRLQSLADELDKQRRLNRELTVKVKELKDNLKETTTRKSREKVPAVEQEWDEDWEEDDEEEEEVESESEEWSPSIGNSLTPLRKAWDSKKSLLRSVADPRHRIRDLDLPEEVPEKKRRSNKRRTFAPNEVTKCKCKSKCEKMICSCRKAGQACTDRCGCNTVICLNKDGVVVKPEENSLESRESLDNKTDLNQDDIFVNPSKLKRGKRVDKENSCEVAASPPLAPARAQKQRSRPLTEGESNVMTKGNASTTSSTLNGTFNVDSIEDDPLDSKTGPKCSSSDDEDDTLESEENVVEKTPDQGYKLPALKARKAKKYVEQVNKEGGYFSPKYVKSNPGLRTDSVE